MNYRVIVVDPDLTPYADVITLKIQDPNQNIITQLVDRALTKGTKHSTSYLIPKNF